MTCASCGSSFEQRHRRGRPRRHCYGCKPDRAGDGSRSAHEAARQKTAKARERYERGLPVPGLGCVCGRDYAALALDGMHRCPEPLMVGLDGRNHLPPHLWPDASRRAFVGPGLT